MMIPMLRGMADGQMYSADKLEEMLAKSMGLAKHDLDVRATDVSHKIGLAKTYLARAGLV